MLKTIFLNTLKIALAAGLVGWLVMSGKLDFRLLAELGAHPLAVTMSVLAMLLNLLLVSYRWRTILKARAQVRLPLGGIVQVNWIGQFFSSVLPGSVSGDLVKILYLQRFDGSFTKKFIFASILIDRIMGLSGLIVLVGLTSLVFGPQISSTAPAMKPLLGINYLLMGAVIISFASFFFFHDLIRALLERASRLALPGLFAKLIGLWDDLVSIKKKMFKAIAVSVLIQFLGVLTFWVLVYPFIGARMSFIQAMAFIPIGFMTLALPVAPSGLGVGHAIFQKLFELCGITNGASLFNLYFVVALIVNVIGVVPYVLLKSKTTEQNQIK